MDERAFIEQKQESWNRLSESLEVVRKSGASGLTSEQLTSLGSAYRAAVSDLSFAKSQGASDELVTYLNQLAGRTHGVVYASRPARLGGLFSFVAKDFPALFRLHLAYTMVAMLVFILGWAVSASNPRITNAVLPQEITKPAGDDQRSLLGTINPALVSSFIMTNNIYVGIKAFAGGITAGTYTVHELWQNGLVIGAIATKAAPALGPARFWSLILPHGIIELMAIFICGGAGLMMGAAIIAPGNLRRVDSVRIAAGKALKLFAGAVLLFVVAGTIEGFITPSSLPDKAKLSFAVVTAIALILYLGFCGRAVDSKQ